MLNPQSTNLQRNFLRLMCLAAIAFTPLASLAQLPAPKPCFDFTDTGRTSFATTTGNSTGGSNIIWHILSNGGDNSAQIYAFGRGDIESRDGIVPGYYDNDNRADAAVVRLSGRLEGDITFYIRPSTLTTSNPSAYYGVPWGVAPDLPVIGDYDGDGKQDIAVYRYADRNFYWLNSPGFNSFSSQNWGEPNSLNLPIGYLHTFFR
jgi:hypothetical protein